MTKSKREKLELSKDNEKVVLKLQGSTKEMEDKLERMGIKRSNSGPRISDQRHMRDTVYSYVSSTAKQGTEHQSEKTPSQVRSYG